MRLKAPFAAVVAAMHEWVSDETLLIHKGNKVRKCHTSRRDALKSIGASPIARFHAGTKTLEMLEEDYPKRRSASGFVCNSNFDDHATLANFYPGMDPACLVSTRHQHQAP